MLGTIKIRNYEDQDHEYTTELAIVQARVSHFINETFAEPPLPEKLPMLEFSYESGEELSSTFNEQGDEVKPQQSASGSLWLMVPDMEEISWNYLKGYRQKSQANEELLPDGMSQVKYFSLSEAEFEIEVLDLEGSRIKVKIVGRELEFNNHSFEINTWFLIED